MTHRVITHEMADRMVELRQAGWTISAIARELEVSRPTVASRLQAHDLAGDLPGERGALITGVEWLRLPPARLRLQLAAEGR